MALSQEQLEAIKQTIKSRLRDKFNAYNPEPTVMPFHTRLLGKDRLALYSFIHSLNSQALKTSKQVDLYQQNKQNL